MLSDSDTDANDLHTLTINEHFAKAFEYKKEREELAKLKEKYGSDYSEAGDSDADDSEDSEDTEEDTDGEELTPAVDAAILRTLALIKKKDPAIYEGERQVFEEEHTRTQDKAPAKRSKTKEKSRQLTIREAALASALAEADPHSRSSSVEPPLLTHTEEQELLRSETRAAFHGVIDSEEEDEDDLLVPRSRTRDEIELEEEEYRAFLEREVGEDIHKLVAVETKEEVGVSNDVEIGDCDRRPKKKKGKKEREKERENFQEKHEARSQKDIKQCDKKSKEDADQEFLLNYIFNRGWIDRTNRRVPTYNEVVASSSKQSERKPNSFPVNPDGNGRINENADDEHLATFSDENSFDDLADAFETSYNFRFEEPGGALIASFPRNVPSARRESTTRKDARTRKKERQEGEKRALLEARRGEIRRERALAEAAAAQEDEHVLMVGNDISDNKKTKREQKKEELARLKALKSKELRQKLEMVSSGGGLVGLGDEALAHLDLDADWDASKHDAQMAELYRGVDDFVGDDDAEKPTWDDDINIDDIEPPPDAKSKAELKKQHKKEKKKKKKADEDAGVDVDEMDADLIQEDWDDDDWWGTEEERKRRVDTYMDEVVNRLGFSGITSHMPTRFHYASTAPENYNLTPAELLLATDAELNSYVGLKKLAPYRVEKGGKAKKNWDPRLTQRLKDFRQQLHSRLGSNYEGAWSVGTNSRSRTTEVPGEKKKRKGKKERAKLRTMQDNAGGDMGHQPEVADKLQKRRHDLDGPASYPDEVGIAPEDATQKKRRRRYHKKGTGESDE